MILVREGPGEALFLGEGRPFLTGGRDPLARILASVVSIGSVEESKEGLAGFSG